ncbi:MAG: hypothetical protein RIC15_01975 [Vicingaceae bacterium]
MNYEEEQRGGILGISLIITMGVLIVGFALNMGNEDNSTLGFFLVVIAMLLVYALFGKMKTTVSSSEINVVFGVGLVKKNIAMNSIVSASIVRNKWYYGWGIRYYGQGWMWNFTGLDAVELNFKDKKSKFRIGTKNASELHRAISENLS